MHVLVIGNPIDGLRFVGPFATAQLATEWADADLGDEEWWTVPMEGPFNIGQAKFEGLLRAALNVQGE